MKIARYKKAHKTIAFYANNFGYRAPYQVLIDATFCQTALQHHIDIAEQLPKYLQAELRLVTTQCIIMEADSLGGAVAGAAQIVKKFLVHKCGHGTQQQPATTATKDGGAGAAVADPNRAPLTGAACMKSMMRQSNYIVATQDRELQDWMRRRAGQALLYLHKRTPVLEQPSEASRKRSERKQDATHGFGEADAKRLAFLKRESGLRLPEVEEEKGPGAVTAAAMKKKFKRKQPNPLSCKKKKKKPTTVAAGGVQKAKAKMAAAS